MANSGEIMPKEPFFNLKSNKREEIKRAAMEEFIRGGYRGASTNRIVERMGISKGSLAEGYSAAGSASYRGGD